MEWIDPTGRRDLTEPVDHLGATQARVLDVGSADVGDRDIDDADDRSTESEDLNSSPLERWLGVSVEHATAGSSTARRAEAAPGRHRGGCPSAVSGEELDELSRAVRAGTFASIDDALLSARHAAAAERRGDNTQGCRVDHHFAVEDHPVTIRRRDRHPSESAPALVISSPPF